MPWQMRVYQASKGMVRIQRKGTNHAFVLYKGTASTVYSSPLIEPFGQLSCSLEEMNEHERMEQSMSPKDRDSMVELSTASEPETTYGPYSPAKLDFDPLKDLNLPGSYDEVVKRFKGLQGERSHEVLN